MGLGRFFRSGGKVAWGMMGAVLAIFAASTALLANTADVRYKRDITRMVFNDNVELLEDVKRKVGASSDTLRDLLSSSPEAPEDRPYVVVSIADRRLWYKQGDETLFTTQVATGSGKVLEGSGGGKRWKFETPRGRLVVQSRETDPVWVPPDWHYEEVARKKGLGLLRMKRGDQIASADGSTILVEGSEIVRRFPDGRTVVAESGEGRELVVNGNIVIPPFGTSQRKYEGVLGTHRLNLGDGYALHGTDKPQSIGQAVSHGCVRLRNEDIETLYRMVRVGTPVFIY